MKGKTIVATGATSGIGEAAVLALAGRGARIVFVARDEARAQATMRRLQARPVLWPITLAQYRALVLASL